MRLAAFTVSLFAYILTAAPVNPELLQRLDSAAGRFQSMSATVTYLTHTEVIDENSTETGKVVMKKVAPGEVQGLINFTAPNQRSVTFEKRSVQIYFPKINTLQVYDLENHGEQLDKFLMIGFGTSGSELAKDYTMTVPGVEAMKGLPGVQAIHLELVPKSGEARQYVKKVDLWIPEHGDPYPLREKITEPSGDSRTMTYADQKINPSLPPEALKLKLPAGFKTEHPGK
ncbi:MAG TPA: outer membrane lipoprotein carrier protein LolA [Bryobacteraceae bacterium]|jgi:outer membrane lipoprotein-sorting protein|nr:outer membrane lipoprotein carrier protein LolA [Bryobacteraceae bacterium]